MSSDAESSRLTLRVTTYIGTIEFGRIPAGVSIIVEVPNGLGIRTSVESQARGVTWLFRAAGHAELILPANMNRVSVFSAGAKRTAVKIAWARSSGLLRLAGGEFHVGIGEGGTGTYSVEHSSPTQPAAPLRLRGSGRCVLLRGGEHDAEAHIDDPAQNLKIYKHRGSVHVRGECAGITVRETPDVSFEGVVSGEVHIETVQASFNSVSAAGSISARRILAVGHVSGEGNRRLHCTSHEFFWAGGGTERVDVRLERDSEALPFALIGSQGPEDRLNHLSEPVQEPKSLVPGNVSSRSGQSGATVKDTMFDCGGGDVELDCPGNDIVVRGARILLSSSSVTLATKSDGPSLDVHEAFIEGLLDLCGGSAAVQGRLHASALINGAVASNSKLDESELVVVARRIAAAHIRARVVRATGEDVTNAIDEASEVHARQHCHVGGPIDEDSTIHIDGEATFAGSVACKTAVRWTPRPWTSEIACNTIDISGEMAAIEILDAEDGTEQAVINFGLSSSVDSVVTSRSVNFELESLSSDGVRRLTVTRSVPVTVATGIGPIDISVVDGVTIHQVAEDEQGPHEQLLLRVETAEPAATVALDAGTGTIVVRANPAGSQCPKLRLMPGSYVLDTEVPDISCEDDVWLNTDSRARIHRLSGSFSTTRVGGRIEGARGRASRRAVLKAWPPNPAFSDRDAPDGKAVVTQGRYGQLIDVDISGLRSPDVVSLRRLEVLDPSAWPLIGAAKDLGPKGHGKAKPDRSVLRGTGRPLSHDNVRAEAQRFREISDVVRERAVSGDKYSASQWAAAHAHALQVKWMSGERVLRRLHRAVGYGVRPLPALSAYMLWVAMLGTILYFADGDCDLGDGYQCNVAERYTFWDSLWRVFLLPGGILRTDIGGAEPYHPVAGHPMVHFVLTLVTGLIIGFVVVSARNYLLRPKTDT